MEEKHDFIEGQEVFLIDEDHWENDEEQIRVLKGVIDDGKCGDTFKFKDEPLEKRVYIPVRWEDGTYGSPLYSSIFHTERDAIQNWSNKEMKRVNEIISNLMKNKKSSKY